LVYYTCSCSFATDVHESENIHISFQLLSDIGNILGISLHFTVLGQTTLQQGFNISTWVHLMTSIPACGTSFTMILKTSASYSILTPPLANQLHYYSDHASTMRIVHSPAGNTHHCITIRSHTCRIACS
jgi:hypothetical protein